MEIIFFWIGYFVFILMVPVVMLVVAALFIVHLISLVFRTSYMSGRRYERQQKNS